VTSLARLQPSSTRLPLVACVMSGLFWLVSTTSTLLLAKPAMSKPAPAQSAAFGVSAWLLEGTVVFCITAPKQTKLNGEFGVALMPGRGDVGLWAEALPKVNSEVTDYLPLPYRMTLKLRDAREIPESVKVEVGICTQDEGCDIAAMEIDLRKLKSTHVQSCAD
jgi:hypothetical protein